MQTALRSSKTQVLANIHGFKHHMKLFVEARLYLCGFGHTFSLLLCDAICYAATLQLNDGAGQNGTRGWSGVSIVTPKFTLPPHGNPSQCHTCPSPPPPPWAAATHPMQLSLPVAAHSPQRHSTLGLAGRAHVLPLSVQVPQFSISLTSAPQLRRGWCCSWGWNSHGVFPVCALKFSSKDILFALM